MLFDEKKAAQIAAFFLHSGGSKLPLLSLMKLMYLAERTSLAKYGEPMIGDSLFSMEHGPVLSHTLDHMNGNLESTPGGWDSWVSDRADYELALKKKITDLKCDLSLLSDADLEILHEIWAKYGHLGKFELRDLTHRICDEWEDPETSSIPIPYSRLLRRVGYSHEVAIEIDKKINAQRQLEIVLKAH
jgi:uncharacterized phage-associated protein